MKYEMRFCVGCYLPVAIEMAQKVLESNAHNEEFSLKLIPGQSGSFEVMKDGITIYSKKATGRLPTVRDLGLSSKASGQSVTQDSDKKVC
jgi:selT/selW/selH-like putative selenoprotein